MYDIYKEMFLAGIVSMPTHTDFCYTSVYVAMESLNYVHFLEKQKNSSLSKYNLKCELYNNKHTLLIGENLYKDIILEPLLTSLNYFFFLI